MRKEERKEKRPRKNVRPSPPNHYQPINYSSPPVSPPSPPYPISSCAATRPLLPSRPPQTEHQRRRSSSLPRPPPDGAPAPPLLLPAAATPRWSTSAPAPPCRGHPQMELWRRRSSSLPDGAEAVLPRRNTVGDGRYNIILLSLIGFRPLSPFSLPPSLPDMN